MVRRRDQQKIAASRAKRLIVTAPADRDLDDIYDWIAHDDAVQAERFIVRLTAAVGKFAKIAHPGKACDDLKPGLRSASLGRYIVYFRVTKSDLIVLRFVHSARDQEQISFADPPRRARTRKNPRE